jgi:sugar diacid utilization regulator
MKRPVALERGPLQPAPEGEEQQLRESVAALYAVVLLGSFMHAAARQEDTAELAAGGLSALTRAPLAAVAWYPEGPTRPLRIVGRSAGTQGIPADLTHSLARFCERLPVLRPSRHHGGQLPGRLRVAGFGELLAVPLRVSTECLGFLLAGGDEASLPEDLTFVQALGTQASTALFAARIQESEAARMHELAALTTVLREQSDLLSRALRLQEGLIDLVLHGRDAATIVEHLAAQIDAAVCLLDADGRLVAHSGEDAAEALALPGAGGLQRALDRLRRDQDPLPLELPTARGSQPVLVQSVATDGEVFGYLVVRSGRLDELGRTVLQGGRLVLALRLLMERTVAEAEERAGRDMIQDALVLHRGGRSFAALAARLGYEQDGPAVVLALRVHALRTGSHNFEAARRRAGLEVSDEIRATTRGLAGAVGEETVAIVRPEAAEACGRRIIARLRTSLPGVPVAIGISDPRSSLGELEAAYREALTAMALAESLSSGVLSFADLGLCRLLFDNEHPDRIQEHIERWLGPLLRYDAAHHTELVRTLACYLAGAGQDEVAAKLSIHSSTVKYRLRRIREILSFDLAHAESRFNIELALRLVRVLRELRPGEGGGGE